MSREKCSVWVIFMYAEIGHRIKLLRGDKTQIVFAELLGISLQGYLRYEYGKRIPPGPVLSRLSEISGKSVDWILSGVEIGADWAREAPAVYGRDDVSMEIMEALKGLNKAQKRAVLDFIDGQKLRAERDKKLKEE